MAEIETMNGHINMAKQEVAALKPVGQDSPSITIATEELSKIVQSTWGHGQYNFRKHRKAGYHCIVIVG